MQDNKTPIVRTPDAALPDEIDTYDAERDEAEASMLPADLQALDVVPRVYCTWLLKHVPLEQLIAEARHWLESHPPWPGEEDKAFDLHRGLLQMLGSYFPCYGGMVLPPAGPNVPAWHAFTPSPRQYAQLEEGLATIAFAQLDLGTVADVILKRAGIARIGSPVPSARKGVPPTGNASGSRPTTTAPAGNTDT